MFLMLHFLINLIINNTRDVHRLDKDEMGDCKKHLCFFVSQGAWQLAFCK